MIDASEPILIDSGRSERGWSHYASAFRCLHLHAMLRLGLDDRSDPLTRGTMGHVAMAHLHARWMEAQQGRDPAIYYPPEDALHAWCGANPGNWEHMPRMLECFRRYLARFPEPPGRSIVGVECSMAAVLGTVNGNWGLWALRDPREVRDLRPAHVSGHVIEATPLECPGHPEHGKPVYITRKLDLVIEDLVGNVFVIDHKFKAVDVSPFTAKKYAMSGEFAVARILARQTWARFTGIALWLIQSCDPWRIERPPVPETPWRDQLFPRHLHRVAHEIAQLERDEPGLHTWPMAQNETSCVGRYERDGCPAMGACMYGQQFLSSR